MERSMAEGSPTSVGDLRINYRVLENRPTAGTATPSLTDAPSGSESFKLVQPRSLGLKVEPSIGKFAGTHGMTTTTHAFVRSSPRSALNIITSLYASLKSRLLELKPLRLSFGEPAIGASTMPLTSSPIGQRVWLVGTDRETDQLVYGGNWKAEACRSRRKTALPVALSTCGTHPVAVMAYRFLWRNNFDPDMAGGFSGSVLCLGKVTDQTAEAICFQNFEGPLSESQCESDHDKQCDRSSWSTFKAGFILPEEIKTSKIITVIPSSNLNFQSVGHQQGRRTSIGKRIVTGP
ncbi:MAG: hypothetical protein MMC33_000100 [Icmadophila ericetorum]|nr:hypothetical protein [Icmadophila ericetorum]